MALSLFPGETNFSTVNPGDSIFKSTKRLDLMLEVFNHIVLSVQAYNRNNTTLQLPVPTSSFDDDAQTTNQSVVLPYYYSNGQKKSSAARYIGEHSNYGTPTTGILADVDNVFDAYVLLVDQLMQINDAITPNVVVTSPQGLADIQDNGGASERTVTTTLPFNSITDSVSGAVIKKAFNYPIFLDMEYDLPY